MKMVGILSTALLTLTLGVGVPAYAQQDQHEQEENKDKAAQEKEKARPEKPVTAGEKKAQEEKNNKPEEKNAQEEKNKQEEKNAQEQHTRQVKTEQKVERGNNNNKGGRIPDERFRANFGQEHRFRVSQANYRDRRFQYGGYWFGFVGEWPSNWLYTQDVYVVDIDGVYYLCNANYPGVNIVLSVTL